MNNKAEVLTLESRVRDVYATPIGHDLLFKILLLSGKSENLVKKGLISNLKLKTLSKFTKGKISIDFLNTLLNLINSEKDIPVTSKDAVKPVWWKEAVFYQIYPRTFADSNNDCIGDLPGIISKLDYLQDLGVNCLWLSPIYDSPMDDNGYDIRDYKKILKDFGTMADFDQLLSEVHKRNMHLIMDLVINHTSDEHIWFQNALKNPESKYHNYYFFKETPNNWESLFSGSAWNYYPENKEYTLHLFSKKQMDLNWDNPDVRDDVIEMVNWWLDKGVDGFRMDVINFISKQPDLPEGDKLVGNMLGITGIENYFYGPNLHKYLKEIYSKAYAPHNAFSVGETPGLGMEMCKLVTGEERKELNMVFSFDHLETPGNVRFSIYKYDLNYYKKYIVNFMENYGNNCWMSLFYNNHDNPKMCSKVTDNPEFRVPVQTLLAVMQFTLKGTPFVFQGEEMGITNYKFSSIDQINDLDSRNYYKKLVEEKNMSPENAFEIIKAGSREHARILLPWNEADKAKNPLISQQTIDSNITALYKKLIALRKENNSLIYGDFKLIDGRKNKFTYQRGNDFLIDCNLSDKKIAAFPVDSSYKLVFPENAASSKLQPYEARVYKKC